MSLLLGFFTCRDLTNIYYKGYNPSFRKLETISLGHSQITAYRKGGGSITSYGIVLRHEKILLPGMLLVKKVGAFSPAYEVKISALESNSVKIVVPPYFPDTSEQSVILDLKRWVYI